MSSVIRWACRTYSSTWCSRGRRAGPPSVSSASAISLAVRREHTAFQARVLDTHVREAADVLADLVYRPTLRSSDLQTERKVVLEEISTVEDTPDDLVFEMHNEALWGSHPYGYSILGTRDTVGRLAISD